MTRDMDTLARLWDRLTPAQQDSFLNIIESTGNSNAERSCRGCGCTEARACVDTDGVPCHWVEWDLCSVCAAAIEPHARAAAE